jgi:hypothetical protein
MERSWQGLTLSICEPAPIIYDDFYIIFLNGEIRLKYNGKLIHSNLGMFGGHFDNKNQSVDFLLVEGK